MSEIETYDRDDPPEVEACVVAVKMEDGEWTYVPRAHDWLSLMPDDAIAAVLYQAADAMTALAETFGPRPDPEGAQLFSLVKKEDDDEG